MQNSDKLLSGVVLLHKDVKHKLERSKKTVCVNLLYIMIMIIRLLGDGLGSAGLAADAN